MKITHCDNHPESKAVITVSVNILPTGYRPVFPGFGQKTPNYFDLCEDCLDLVQKLGFVLRKD